MVTRMRCRNVLLCYALLDPYHQGYIDVQEACDAIGNIHKQDKDVAEILLVQLQDMIAYVSPRGVIEKQDFLAEILRRVESDLAGTTPYYCLRGSSNPVSNAWQRGRPFTTVKNRSFYQGDYVPKGVQMHLKQADGDVAEFHLRRRGGGGMTLQEDRPFTQAKPRAQGTLEDHIQRGRLRRMQKLKQIKDDILNKEMAECTFHPKTTPLPPITKPFPSRETMRRMIEQQQKAKKRSQVFIEYDPTDTVTHELALPPELTEKEKKSVREGGNDWSLAEQEPERDELFTWVVHAGDPPTKPKAVEVAWRARDLPKVPREAEFVADAQDSTQLRPTDMPQTARLRTPINAHEELPSRPSATPRKPTVEEVPCEQPVQDPVPSEDVVIQAPYLTEREFDSRFDAFVPEAWQTPAEDPGIHVHDNEGDGRLNFNSLPVYYRQSLQQLFRGGAVAKGGRRPTREEREAKLKECMKILEDAC
ncbi:conserved hypothetical protein [Neospora caninum Liverpool]|nr:conserved hypothetical protein [Neospora caninum Liverpool]CBZ49550.1 conserved hypothetical protein [Neospora caninum Liverpool]|eukprot:XP_003879585.1 conserved hypothetical protein [Neospora caninum Liverpool]